MLRSPTSSRTYERASARTRTHTIEFWVSELNRDACQPPFAFVPVFHLTSNGLTQLFSRRLYNFKQFHCKPHNLLNLLRSARGKIKRVQAGSKTQYRTMQSGFFVCIMCSSVAVRKARSKNTFQEIKSHTDNMSKRNMYVMLSSVHKSSSSAS